MLLQERSKKGIKRRKTFLIFNEFAKVVVVFDSYKSLGVLL